MRTRRFSAIAAACIAALGTACGGGSGAPHTGAAPPIAHTSQLATKLAAVRVKCSSVTQRKGFIGEQPLPQEYQGCRFGKDQIELYRYRDFDEVKAALRLTGPRAVCEFAKVLKVRDVPYLYGDNWLVIPDPEFPDVTKAIMKALDAGTWTLHC